MPRGANAAETIELDERMPENGHVINFPVEHTVAQEGIGEQESRRTVYRAVKRLIDVVGSLCALVLLSPLFLVIAVAIKVDSKGPVFFTHSRLGWRGAPLHLYKFRSMVSNAQELMESFTPAQKREFERNYKLDHDPRITKVGSFLRRTSLDELPQLLNILQGDLSIVGPRPLVKDEIKKYGVLRNKFLSVKPGLTGYWQVNGRSSTSYEDRIKLELYYVDHWGFWLDVEIILRTICVVFRKHGAK